jgi:hypothetical protein
MVLSDPFLEKFVSKNLKGDSKIFPLAGDASNRRYYRVVNDNNSSVLMRWEPFDPNNYPFLSVLNHFDRNGVRVPKVIAMSPDEGLVLLEDLGDLTLERKFWENQTHESSILFYKMAIDELIKIHYDATDNKADCTAFKIKFDTEKFLWEMNYGKDNLLLGVLEFKMSDKAADELQKIFTDVCSKLDKEPKRIAHRDYHSRNLMIKLDEMRVIDFQDARLGPVQYDLVSLFKDSYVDMNEDMVKLLMGYYLDKSKSHLPKDFSQEYFMRIYELQSVQRCFKACGSFASFFHQRKDRRYLKYLAPTLKRTLKSLNNFPEYKAFTDILIDSGALEKKYETL